MPIYDQELLSIALTLKDAGITNDQVTRLHHFSLVKRRETINSTIRWIERSQDSEIVGNNIEYFERLRFLYTNISNKNIGNGISEQLVDQALLRYPLQGQGKYVHPTGDVAKFPSTTNSRKYIHMNHILYGPPGTGKTYIVREKAAEICGKERDDYAELVKQGRIDFITFHQSYSYEDFVEGIRPVTKNGVVNYEIRQGIFRQMCNDAEKDPDNNYVLIIDEINRASISKVFGELITLLELDKRLGADNEIKVQLPYSGAEFGIPSNLYLIGTMNTADRSIALLDTALRRRFEFEEMMPKPTDLPIKLINGEDGKEPIELVIMLESLNKRVEYLYDRDHTIGHAFFWNVKTLDDLRTVFRRKVIPLLQEYFYEDWKKIGQVLNDAGDGSAFLRVVDLPPPRLAALDNGYGETRKRYSVNEQFSADAFRNIYAD